METKKNLYLVLEYASGGSLLDYIQSKGSLKECESKDFVKQLCSALNFMHGINIAHRDIKADNILLDNENNIKISDFGLSVIYQPHSLLATACGSPVYSAPEVIEGRRYLGPEADIWSLGNNFLISRHKCLRNGSGRFAFC